MASLQELHDGLIKADAAGNSADAKAFADAIRAMQGAPTPSTTPAPAPTGGITFAPDAEGQGYGPNGDRNLAEQIGHVGAATVAKPLAPLAAATAGGAALGLMGGPFAELTVPAGAGLGALTYTAAHLADVPVGAYNSVTPNSWYKLPMPGQGFDQGVTSLLPKSWQPENTPERVAGNIVQTVGDAAAGNEAGVLLKTMNNPYLRGAGEAMGSDTTKGRVMNAGLGAASGVGAEVMGGLSDNNPAMRTIGGLAAPLLAVGGANVVPRVANVVGPDVMATRLFGGGKDAATQLYAENEGAKRLQKLAGNDAQRQAAIEQLSPENLEALSVNGYKPMTGSASDNPNFINQERRLANQTDITGMRGENKGVTVLSRQIDNSKAIKSGFDTAMTPSDVSPEVAQQYVGGKLTAQQTAAEQAAAAAKAEADAAASELGNKQADLIDRGSESVRTGAAGQIRDSLTTEHDAMKARVDDAFSKVPSRTVIPLDKSVRVAKKLVKEADARVGDLPPEIQKFLDIATNKKGKLNATEARDNLSELFAAAENLPKGSPAAAKVAKLRDALDADVSKIGEVSKPLRVARDLFKNEYVPRFIEGHSNAIFRQKGAGGADAVSRGNTLNGYMNEETEAGRLRSALSSSGDLREKDLANVRDWAVSSMMANKATVNRQTLEAWIRNNSAKLDKWPEIRTEVEDLASSLGQSEQKSASLSDLLKQRQGELKNTTKYTTESNEAKFSQGGADNAKSVVADFLNGNHKGMRDVLEAVKGDPQAMESFKNSFKDAVSAKARGYGKEASGVGNSVEAPTLENYNITPARINRILTDAKTRRLMEQIFTREEMSALDQVRKQANVSIRLNEKATTGSDTASSLTTKAEEKRAIQSSNWTLPGVKTLKSLLSVKELGKAGIRSFALKDPELAVQQFIADAMLDPNLARTALMRPTEKNLPLMQKNLNAWIQSYGRDTSQPQEDTSMEDIGGPKTPADKFIQGLR
jgi:hypothetical protein